MRNFTEIPGGIICPNCDDAEEMTHTGGDRHVCGQCGYAEQR